MTHWQEPRARGSRLAVLAQLKHQQAELLATIAREIGDTAQAQTPAIALPGDPWKLRGIPVVGVHGGVGGAILHTRPGDGLA